MQASLLLCLRVCSLAVGTRIIEVHPTRTSKVRVSICVRGSTITTLPPPPCCKRGASSDAPRSGKVKAEGSVAFRSAARRRYLPLPPPPPRCRRRHEAAVLEDKLIKHHRYEASNQLKCVHVVKAVEAEDQESNEPAKKQNGSQQG